MVDLQSGVKLRDITVGPPLSHPQGIVVDRAGPRAYVALSALRRGRRRRPAAAGAWSARSRWDAAPGWARCPWRWRSARRARACSWPSRAPTRSPSSACRAGRRRPAARLDAGGSHPDGRRPPGRGHRRGPGRPRGAAPVRRRQGRRRRAPTRPAPSRPIAFDPIFWAFNPLAPDHGRLQPSSGTTYLPAMVGGRAGLMRAALGRAGQAAHARRPPPDPPARRPEALPPGRRCAPADRSSTSSSSCARTAATTSSSATSAAATATRQLIVFGKNVTPNLHSLVTRFPLLDHVFANSEASIQGHFWTAAASVPDYVDRNWVQEYAGRGRPNDFGVYAVTFPGNGFLFDQAERQHISYFNYGEAIAGDEPTVTDRDRSRPAAAGGKRGGRQLRPRPRPHARRQLPQRPDHRPAPARRAEPGGEIFDSSLPAGRPAAGSYSHMDCFRDAVRRASSPPAPCRRSTTSR